jgi:tetratricopeptide (TPR) repeat protein
VIARSFLLLVSVYARQLVWPAGLDIYRPYRAPTAAAALIALALVLSLVLVPAVLLWRRRAERGPRAAALGAAIFVFGLLPCALVGPHLDMIGDRYAHLPLAGIAIVLAACLPLARGPAWLPRFGIALATACLAAEAAGVYQRAADYRDDVTLAQASLRTDPNGAYALYTLGRLAAEAGNLAAADRYLTASLSSDANGFRTYNALCYVRLEQDRLPEAEQACNKSLSFHASNPRAWVNLGMTYTRTKRWVEAASAAAKALAIKPSYPQADYVAAVAYANLGRIEQARAHLDHGLLLEPGHKALLDLRAQVDRATAH